MDVRTPQQGHRVKLASHLDARPPGAKCPPWRFGLSRAVHVIAATTTADTDGIRLDPDKVDLTGYSGVVLAEHDRHRPVGVATVNTHRHQLHALVRFDLLDRDARRTYRQLRQGIRSCSIGGTLVDPVRIDPDTGKPGSDTPRPWRLHELSIVAMPADANARLVTTARR
jgi:hypothetical protein